MKPNFITITTEAGLITYINANLISAIYVDGGYTVIKISKDYGFATTEPIQKVLSQM
jgi:hypothetical protein